MRKFFLTVITMMMTVCVSAQFCIYLSNGSVIVADSISMVMPSDDPVASNFTPAAFSVSADTQVQFSQGNLQYQPSTSTWRFAEHQYDMIGADNSNISATYNGWIDLFGWGTGSNPTNTSANYNDYSTFVDWGVNAISNGGNSANQWRTLTYNEWYYLFYTRTNAANLRGQATVNGVHGYIFLPDDFTLPLGYSFYANPSDWSANTYSAAEWSKWEALGAVFLPAAGDRYGSDVYYVESYGYYWSSTPYDANYAYYLDFNSSNAYMSYYNRYYGQSVRLVHVVTE